MVDVRRGWYTVTFMIELERDEDESGGSPRFPHCLGFCATGRIVMKR